MTAEEFNAALARLKWKQSDFCRFVDVNKSTASRWSQDGPPAWAAHYLTLVLEIDDLHSRYVRPAKPVPLPAPKTAEQENAGQLPASTRAAKALKRLKNLKG
jgi:hypothetical protein